MRREQLRCTCRAARRADSTRAALAGDSPCRRRVRSRRAIGPRPNHAIPRRAPANPRWRRPNVRCRRTRSMRTPRRGPPTAARGSRGARARREAPLRGASAHTPRTRAAARRPMLQTSRPEKSRAARPDTQSLSDRADRGLTGRPCLRKLTHYVIDAARAERPSPLHRHARYEYRYRHGAAQRSEIAAARRLAQDEKIRAPRRRLGLCGAPAGEAEEPRPETFRVRALRSGQARDSVDRRRCAPQSLRQLEHREDRPVGRQQFGTRQLSGAAPAQPLAVQAPRLAAVAPDDPNIEQYFAMRIGMAHPDQRPRLADRRCRFLRAARAPTPRPALRPARVCRLGIPTRRPDVFRAGRCAISTRLKGSITTPATT